MNNSSTSWMTRRRMIIAAAGVAAFATSTAIWQSGSARRAPGVEVQTPEEAYRSARTGRITLIDIRRPNEWRRTGLGAGALPLDMRRPDFTTALDALVDGDRTRPIALICARGVRSARLSARLQAAGYAKLIDVPEGMLGSRAGPGWLRRDLPVVAWP